MGIQCESCGEVTRHTGHTLDVHTVVQGDGCERVAEVVKYDLRDIVYR